MDCDTALTIKSSAPVNAHATTTSYSTVSTSLTYSNGYTDIFNNVDGLATGCPVTSCEFRDSNCANLLANTVNV